MWIQFIRRRRSWPPPISACSVSDPYGTGDLINSIGLMCMRARSFKPTKTCKMKFTISSQRA